MMGYPAIRTSYGVQRPVLGAPTVVVAYWPNYTDAPARGGARRAWRRLGALLALFILVEVGQFGARAVALWHDQAATAVRQATDAGSAASGSVEIAHTLACPTLATVAAQPVTLVGPTGSITLGPGRHCMSGWWTVAPRNPPMPLQWIRVPS